MGLGMKGRAGEPPVFTFAHHPLHVLVRDLQVSQQHPLELVAPFRVLRHLPHPIQYRPQVPAPDRFAK